MLSVMVYLERDVSPNTNQATPTVYNRTAVRPSSPDHAITSCCVCGAPNGLEKGLRSVAAPEKPPAAAPEKPPAASFQPVTNKD